MGEQSLRLWYAFVSLDRYHLLDVSSGLNCCKDRIYPIKRKLQAYKSQTYPLLKTYRLCQQSASYHNSQNSFQIPSHSILTMAMRNATILRKKTIDDMSASGLKVTALSTGTVGFHLHVKVIWRTTWRKGGAEYSGVLKEQYESTGQQRVWLQMIICIRYHRLTKSTKNKRRTYRSSTAVSRGTLAC